ncbi:MAG TPA: hypothetical protein VMW72_14165 [Sedimentisphaerales bacterium]|nr:hypothetical protein [Sedimentisphaerales bacterium]
MYITLFDLVCLFVIGYIAHLLWHKYSKDAAPWREAEARKREGKELELDPTYQDHDPDPEFTKECERKAEEHRKKFLERTKHLRKPERQNNQAGHNYCGRFKKQS